MIVYKLTSPSNKSYIGLTTTTIEDRFKQHIQLWTKLKKQNKPYTSAPTKLCYAFDQYDPQNTNWQLDVLFETDNIDILCQKEIELIEQFDTINTGYNIMSGGQCGWAGQHLLDQHKNNISAARKKWFLTEEGKLWKQTLSKKFKQNNPGIPWPKGKPLPQQTKDKIKATKLANPKKFTTEQRQQMSQEAKKRWENGVYDNRKPISSESYAKTAANRIGKYRQTDYQKQKVAESKQKKWLVTTPEGQSLEIVNLTLFCRENNIASSQANLSKHGRAKGYTAIRLE